MWILFCRLLDTGDVLCVSYGIRIGWPLLLIRAFNATVVSQSHANAKNSNEAVQGIVFCGAILVFTAKTQAFLDWSVDYQLQAQISIDDTVECLLCLLKCRWPNVPM